MQADSRIVELEKELTESKDIFIHKGVRGVFVSDEEYRSLLGTMSLTKEEKLSSDIDWNKFEKQKLGKLVVGLHKELTDAKDRLYQIRNLCDNCAGLSDAQAIAGGQILSYLKKNGCCSFENERKELVEARELIRLDEETIRLKDKEIARLNKSLTEWELWKESNE